MSKKKILILGFGHLANRTKTLLHQKGFDITHLPNLFNNLPSSDSSTINETDAIFRNLDMNSFCMTYVLFENDEDNLEIVIAMMALYADIPISTSLFNENIIPHLHKANPKLTVLNPAKLAAPFFVKDIDNNFNKKPDKRIKNNDLKTKSKPRNRFLKILISIFFGIIIGSIIFFKINENLSWIDAIYFVVVTVSTVGYGDINLQHSNILSKSIGIMLILCSTIFIWLIFSLIIDNIIKKRAQLTLGRKKYKYKNHIILCGLGRLGYYIAQELQNKNLKIVIIEQDQNLANVEYFRKQYIDVYIGNARQPQVLEDVGAEHCAALISVINNDFGNLEIGLNARYFQPNIILILRIFDESMAEIIKDKFDIHLSKSMSFIAAESFANMIDLMQLHSK